MHSIFPRGKVKARFIVPLLAAGALLVPAAAASAAPSGSTGRAVARTAAFPVWCTFQGEKPFQVTHGGPLYAQGHYTGLESANGTALERGKSPRSLVAGEPVTLQEKDRLVLADAVTIRLSGQQHFSDEQQQLPRLGTAGGGRTRMFLPEDLNPTGN